MTAALPGLIAAAAPGSLLPERRAAEAARVEGRLAAVAYAPLPRPGLWFALVEDGRGVRYGVPARADTDAGLVRARVGDGAAQAIVAMVAGAEAVPDGLRVTRLGHVAAAPLEGERAVDVDQTNELVAIGNAVMVKWMLHPATERQPGPDRLRSLADAGFAGTPRPLGLVEIAVGSSWALVATVTEYVPDTRDGWEWAVDDVRALVRGELSPRELTDRSTTLGRLVGELHRALAMAGTSVATTADVVRWTMSARLDVDAAPIDDDVRDRILDELAVLDAAVGTTIIDIHGDLHIGQVLRQSGTERLLVVDFDGNPTQSSEQRLARQPAARDVASMLTSLDHVGRVVLHRTDDLAARQRTAVLAWIDRAQADFLAGYRAYLDGHGALGLLEGSLIRPFELQQECREYAYAERYLPHWRYVPDAALPALLTREPR
ncbi:MAG: aminoglycoside phosphotransferase [Actinomycetota bacterium]|nr:aminoglycoside phosphotransferase [Actinomycetota bacterium]